MSSINQKERRKLNIEIGARYKQARINAGYTQEQPAEAIDTSTQFLSDAERGVTGMSLSTIIRLCTTLSVSADYILLGQSSRDSYIPLSFDARISHLSEQERHILETQINLTIQAFKVHQDTP